MKKFQRVLLIGGAPVCILAAVTGTAYAGNSGAASSCSNNQVQPYTGGAGVSRFFNMPDGSGVTITTTGAVIKQSPCGTPYREGWVNPNNISGINSYGEIPKLQSGATNPYTVKTSHNNVPSPPPSNTQSSSNNNGNNTSSATANATANVNISGTPQVAAASTTNHTGTHRTGTSANSSAATSAGAATGATTLPNTGPGNVLAIGGITTAVGAIGHFLYRTLRFRYLS